MLLTNKFLLRALLLLMVAVVVTGMVVPYSLVQDALRRFGLLQHLEDFIYSVAPGIELNHLLAFGAIGFTTHFALQGARAWQVGIGCLALATVVEVIQIWIPGRQAAVLHAMLEVAGGVAGFALAWLFTYAWDVENAAGRERSTTFAREDSVV